MNPVEGPPKPILHSKHRKTNNPFYFEKPEAWMLNKKNVIITIYIPIAIISFLSIAAFCMSFMAIQHHKPETPKIVWKVPKAYPALPSANADDRRNLPPLP